MTIVPVPSRTIRRRNPDIGFSSRLIAPCGINCRVCIAYLREKNPCNGCRDITKDKPKTRTQCRIKLCEHLQGRSHRFCVECHLYPCQRLRQMDFRYRSRYHLSIINNLKVIDHEGVRKFLQHEKIRWKCPQCGNILCVHKNVCLFCDSPRNFA